MKDYLVHSAQTMQCVSIRIVLIVAKIKVFRIWVIDVELAYFHSEKLLIRKFFITNPAPEFKQYPEECYELIERIYGLADSGDE